MENVAGQVGQLTTKLLHGAAEQGIQTKTPADSVGPLVVLKARDPEALVKKLEESRIVVSSRHDGLRISVHVYNSRQDVEALLHALSKSLDLLVVDSTVPTRN
jgi:selenocysteine lyase/cysteine desulfurase